MGSSGTTPAQTSPRADAQSPGADAHSPMLRQPSTPAAGVSAIEAAAGKTCLKDPAAHSLDQAGGRQQTQGLSSIGGSMRRDSSSSSSSEEEHSGDGNSPATSHVEAHAARAVADADGAAAGADADADRADAGRALTTSGAEPSLQTEGECTCCKCTGVASDLQTLIHMGLVYIVHTHFAYCS